MSRLISRLSKRYFTIRLLISFLVSACGVLPAQAETYVQFVGRMMQQGHFRADIEKALFLRINQYRASQGKRALAPDPSLQFAARAHAEDMASHGFIGHVASTGQDFDSRMRAFKGGGMLVLPSMGENAAAFPATGTDVAVAEGLFQSWLHSDPHRRAIVSNDYIRAAIGVSVLNGTAYADQIFVGPQMSSSILPMAQ